jgi:Rad3-related DNA helicase
MLSSKDTGQKRESNILIVDEAHELEEVLTGFISMKLTEKTIKSFSFDNEKELLNRLKDAADIEKYISLIKDVCQAAKNKLSTIKQDEMDNKDRNPISDQRANKLNKFYGSDSDGIKNLKLQTKLREIVSKTDIFLEKYTQNPPNWILEKVWSEATKNYEFSIDPVWVGDYMNEYVWNRYDKVILMSGTILDIDLFCQVNGLSKHEVNYKSWQSPFPIENRRTIYAPIGSMSMKDKVETFKKYIPFLTNIFNHYSGKKGVIHTNSFELSNWIERDMKKNKRLLFHTSLNKQDILIEHFESKKDSIIVSPSVGTGVDFDDDKSRFQIIAKIPYPSLASARNKRRQELNKEWYSWKTVCTLIQMMGRSIRHKEDYADTYIIDSGFGGLLYYSRKYFPKWVTDTIVDKSKQMK